MVSLSPQGTNSPRQHTPQQLKDFHIWPEAPPLLAVVLCVSVYLFLMSHVVCGSSSFKWTFVSKNIQTESSRNILTHSDVHGAQTNVERCVVFVVAILFPQRTTLQKLFCYGLFLFSFHP